MRNAKGLFVVVIVASIALFRYTNSAPFGLQCPEFLSWLVPPQLYCKICRTATLSGPVSDCSCDFETVDTATISYFHPLLSQLQTTRFFRFFKVNLDKPCPFWDDSDETCSMKDCSVEVCSPEKLPSWLNDVVAEKSDPPPTGEPCDSYSEDFSSEFLRDSNLGTVVTSIALQQAVRWATGNDAELWIDDIDESSEAAYVDLQENPERLTGYSGKSPRRIWQAIYEENCFESEVTDQIPGQCLEKRVFYRLISGLQASITTHIAKGYFYGTDYGTKGYWAPNTGLFVDRVGMHPDRLHNMYFTYLFLLRALAKAGSELEALSIMTGDSKDDARARALIRALVHPDHPLMTTAPHAELQMCQRGFDERRLFSVPSEIAAAETAAPLMDRSFERFGDFMEAASALRRKGDAEGSTDADATLRLHASEASVDLRTEFQARFRNISRIMDCVGCEKCRLWGKLQILGIGTALKILLSPEDLATDDASNKRGYTLQRNEVIALLNTLAQISTSVKSIQDWRVRELQLALASLMARVAIIAGVALILRWSLSTLLYRRRISA